MPAATDASGALCDVVIPVHNALHRALALLESLVDSTALPHRVLLVDDASDPFAAAVLRERAAAIPDCELLRLDANVGFVRAANAGLARTTAPFVCLLNSDTLVTPGWLERLWRCAESDPTVLVVNPISNAAADLSVVMPPGYTPWMMADRLAVGPAPAYPDVVTAVGFCFFLKREALRRWPGFDEAYGRGYCEESDYCMQVLSAGFRVVAADDAFVFHAGESSFPDREERYARNRALFDSRWRADYERLRAAYARRDPLQRLRDDLFADLVLAGHLRPSRPARSAAYRIWRALGHLARGNRRLLAERTRDELAALRRRLRRRAATSGPGPAPEVPTATTGHSAERFAPDDQPLAFPTPAYLRALPRSPDRLRIVFLLHDAPLSGGVIEVVQIANRLILEGHDAIVATCSTEEIQHRLGLLSQPLVYADDAQLLERFPAADVVVATHWRTADAWLAPLSARGDFVPVYFVQDFEPDFYPAFLPERRRALESYRRIPNLVATSAWLQTRLAGLGRDAARIPLGVDLGRFYPRDRRREDEPFTVTAVARPDPDEARRGFAELLEAAARVHAADPTIRFAFFGCDPAAMPRRPGFPVANLGPIADPDAVARHLSRCDVLVDPSRYQAFGRPGLEAMACGVATVLPRQGGVAEYARDGENTLAFDGGDAGALAAAILRLRRDDALRARIAREGRETALGLDHVTEGRRHLAHFRSLLSRRKGGATDLPPGDPAAPG